MNYPKFVPDAGLATPRDTAQNIRIRPGSPLAVVGLFVEVVRQRFRPEVVGTEMDWVWKPNIKETKLAIESAYVKSLEHRNFKPAIFVDVDGATFGQVTVGDRVGQNLKSSQEGFLQLDTQPVSIEVKASERGECFILADLVRAYLQASSDLIQATFLLHTMTPVQMGRPVPSKEDKDVFVASINFTVQVPARWSSKPTAPLLKEIELEVKRSNQDPTAYFTQIAITGSADTDTILVSRASVSEP